VLVAAVLLRAGPVALLVGGRLLDVLVGGVVAVPPSAARSALTPPTEEAIEQTH
jgi:hypothetical protein